VVGQEPRDAPGLVRRKSSIMKWISRPLLSSSTIWLKEPRKLMGYICHHNKTVKPAKWASSNFSHRVSLLCI
jgi:hypothetical protein